LFREFLVGPAQAEGLRNQFRHRLHALCSRGEAGAHGLLRGLDVALQDLTICAGGVSRGVGGLLHDLLALTGERFGLLTCSF